MGTFEQHVVASKAFARKSEAGYLWVINQVNGQCCEEQSCKISSVKVSKWVHRLVCLVGVFKNPKNAWPSKNQFF